jgi:hypothetical protein
MALLPPRLCLPAADWEEELMPKRGSVQLLLLFFRAQPRWIGAFLGGLVLLGLVHGEGPGLKSGITQSLRQSAWKHALAGEPMQQPWPWDTAAPPAQSLVPRLGLSATVLANADWRLPQKAVRSSAADGRDPHLDLGDAAVGDSIAVTRADGLTQIYRVTRRHVVDPVQTTVEELPSEAGPHLLACSPLDLSVASALRLVIDAVRVDPGATTTTPIPEQKL